MKLIYKSIMICCLMAFYASAVTAQNVSFRFSSDFAYSNSLKQTAERNISKLLSEFSRCGKTGQRLNLNGIDMEDKTRERLHALWDNCPFVCLDNTNIQSCLKDFEGYQVRGIEITMIPQDKLYKDEMDRELVIAFNRSGEITSISLTLNSSNAYAAMREGVPSKDSSERRTILKFLENLRCYYNEKDTVALRAIYSDDPIMIADSIILRCHSCDNLSSSRNEILYNKQNKEQYLMSVEHYFAKNRYINMEFDKIEILKHPSKPGYYGITVHQKWDASHHTNDGWLFMLWDFNNSDQPTIHVRTWQPWQVKEDDVFTLDDFPIY